MLKKIFLLDPYSSQYNTLHHFTFKFYEAWVRAGYQAKYFTDVEKALDEALQNPPDLMIGFNGIPKKEEAYFSDIIKKPFFTLLVDPFFRFFDVTSSTYTIVGCDDFSGCTSLKRLNFQNVLFVPHAVESDLSPDPNVDRIYDVTFLATFIDYESRRQEWKSIYPEWVCKAMDKAVDRTFSELTLPFSDAILDELQKYPQWKALSTEIDSLAIFRDVEIYIKGKERVELLKAIQTSPVHVFGDSVDGRDWKKYFEKQDNIIVHDPVSYDESLDIMKRSKIVLNSSIKNKFGAHERIFSGLAAGALVLTHENVFLKQFFAHDVDIAFYSHNNLDQINHLIHSYLSDDDKRLQIVENGRDVVMNFHTWDARIKSLVPELSSIIDKITSL